MKIQSKLISLSLSALFAAAGCHVGGLDSVDPPGPGGPDDPGDPGTPDAPPDYTLRVDSPSAALTLGNTAQFQITLSSMRFAGPVTLVANGVPSSWEVGFEPSATATLPLDGEAVVTMNVVVPTNAEAATASIAVQADAQPGARESAVSVAVENVLLVDIGAGTGGGVHAFPPVAEVRLGATIQFQNSDTVGHRIHADNDNDGFPHQPDAMNPGDSYTVTPTVTRGYNYYCHTHDVAAGTGRLQVVDAPATP